MELLIASEKMLSITFYNSLVVQCVMQSAHEQHGSGGRWKLESFFKKVQMDAKKLDATNMCRL